MSDRPAQQRTIAILLLTGAVLLMAGNVAHPVDADLTATSRFELATGSSWVAIHLALAGGFAAITAALVALARAARAHTALAARCCEVAAIIGGTLLVAVFASLDGFAISSLAEAWQSSTGSERVALDGAALAINAIDSGLAGVGTLLLLGVALLGAARLVVVGGVAARWIGWALTGVGVVGTVAGVLLVALGPTTLTINALLRPAGMAATILFVVLGVSLLRAQAEDELTGTDRVDVVPASG